MKKLLIFLIMMVSPVFAVDPDIAARDRWDVNVDSPVAKAINITRGETVIIEPTFYQNGKAVNLSGANTVLMRYKSNAMTNYYLATGMVYNATSGIVRIRWTAAMEAPQSQLTYEIVVSGSSSTVVRAKGPLTLMGSMADNGATTIAPRTYSLLDFATVELANVGLAPFLSSYDVADLTTFMNSCQDGTAALDLNTLNVRGALTGSAGDMTNFPTYLMRGVVNGGTAGTTGTVSEVVNGYQTITFPVGGGGGGGSSYLSNLLDVAVSGPVTNQVLKWDGTNWVNATSVAGASAFSNLTDVAIANLTINDSVKWDGTNWVNYSSGESLGTNRLAWVVGGVTIGYVDTNGITMLKGSLQLYEEDLNCNVRSYDGAKATPSISFYARPDMGWYKKSYVGDYAWTYTHTNTDVLFLNRYGLTMASTNPVNAYAVNVSGAYRYNGTNGSTRIITNVVNGVTNLISVRGGIICD